MCCTKEDDARKQHDPRRSHISTREACVEAKLERILGLDGNMTRPMTEKQRGSGRRLGSAVIKKCHACRKHL